MNVLTHASITGVIVSTLLILGCVYSLWFWCLALVIFCLGFWHFEITIVRKNK